MKTMLFIGGIIFSGLAIATPSTETLFSRKSPNNRLEMPSFCAAQLPNQIDLKKINDLADIYFRMLVSLEGNLDLEDLGNKATQCTDWPELLKPRVLRSSATLLSVQQSLDELSRLIADNLDPNLSEAFLTQLKDRIQRFLKNGQQVNHVTIDSLDLPDTKSVQEFLINPNAVSLSPDGTKLLLGTTQNGAQVIDLESGKSLWSSPKEKKQWIEDVKWSKDGKYILILSSNKLVIRSGTSFRYIRTVRIENWFMRLPFEWRKSYRSIAISPRNNEVSLIMHDDTVKIWSAKLRRIPGIFEDLFRLVPFIWRKHSPTPRSKEVINLQKSGLIDYSPDGRFLAIVQRNEGVKIIDRESWAGETERYSTSFRLERRFRIGNRVSFLRQKNSPVVGFRGAIDPQFVKFSPLGWVAVGNDTGLVEYWDPKEPTHKIGSIQCGDEGVNQSITAFDFTDSGELLGVLGYQGNFYILDLKARKKLYEANIGDPGYLGTIVYVPQNDSFLIFRDKKLFRFNVKQLAKEGWSNP